MGELLETDALKVSEVVISEVETTTGVLMPGDERRILMDGAAYAIAHQNIECETAWESLDVRKATGAKLTARGAAQGIFRQVGSPAQIWVEFRKSDSMTITIPAGTRLVLNGEEWQTNIDVSSAGISGDVFDAPCTASVAHPNAEQTARQNGITSYAGMEGHLVTENVHINRVRMTPRDDAYLAWAVADDTNDDDLFRSRIIDAVRPGDYPAMVRQMLPNAKAVHVANPAPGEVSVMAIRADGNGFASNFDSASITNLTAFMRTHPMRLHGDHVTAVRGKELTARAVFLVTCDRGFSGSVQASMGEEFAKYCRGFADFGGEYDIGDLLRFFDGQPHVRFVDFVNDASTLDGARIRLGGKPGHYILGDGEFLRIAPENITLNFAEVN